MQGLAVDIHAERHTGDSQAIRDLILGVADGLTVPFALAAGVSGAVAGSGLVVTAGLAEIVAGAISMGLGGYLAVRTQMQLAVGRAELVPVRCGTGRRGRGWLDVYQIGRLVRRQAN